MRIHIVGAAVVVSLSAVPFDAAAQSPCVKPWAIADKWIDNHDETEPIDHIWTPDDTFETVDAHGNPLSDADVYNPAATGFSLADVGRRVWLKVSDAGAATQGWFHAVDIGGAGGGGDAYRTAIATCDPAATASVHVGDALPMLMGNLHGPTIQGVLDLFWQNSSAFWDDETKTVYCGYFGTPCPSPNPRIFAVATFNPAEFERSRLASGTPRLIVTNVVGVFLEAYAAGYVIGVLTPIPAQ